VIANESSVWCSISLVSLERASDGNLINCHQHLERQPVLCETRTHGFNAGLIRTFCFWGGCADYVQLERGKSVLLAVSITTK